MGYMEYFYCILSTMLGLVTGSFLNVVALRAFSGESIVLPPSKCPACKNKLKWYHNIPVLSYMFLRGKCGFCAEKISSQYPIVELVTGLTFLIVYLSFGLTWNTLFLFVISSIFIVITVTDLKEQVIFVEHTYVLAGVGLIYALFQTGEFIFDLSLLINSVLGIVVGFGAMELISLVSKKITKHRAFGEGDSYILGAIGAIVGVKPLLLILVMAACMQAFVAVPMLLKQYLRARNYAQFSTIVIFIALTGIFYYFMDVLVHNVINYLILLVVLALLGLFICWNLIKNIKSGTQLTFMPFGPALVIAAFVFIISKVPFTWWPW